MTSESKTTFTCEKCKEEFPLHDLSEFKQKICNSCCEAEIRGHHERGATVLKGEISYLFDRLEYYKAALRQQERREANA